jgi:plasmid stability protein
MSNTTLTIRTDSTLRKALQERAFAQGKTVSQVVREILEAALVEQPLAARTGHLQGQLELPAQSDDPWRKQMRERNWRP